MTHLHNYNSKTKVLFLKQDFFVQSIILFSDNILSLFYYYIPNFYLLLLILFYGRTGRHITSSSLHHFLPLYFNKVLSLFSVVSNFMAVYFNLSTPHLHYENIIKRISINSVQCKYIFELFVSDTFLDEKFYFCLVMICLICKY